MIGRLESSDGKIDKLTFNLGPVHNMAQDREQLPAIADRVARAKD